MSKHLRGALVAEAVAVFLIIVIGCSVAAMYVLYTPSPYQVSYWGLCMTWGAAVALAIYVTGPVSGCHANPAVTLALAVYRGFLWRRVLPYIVAQVVGAFAGAAAVLWMFGPVIDAFNISHGLTRAGGGAAGVFFTHAGEQVSVGHAFGVEVLLTALLVFGIFALTDPRNPQAPDGKMVPLFIGLLVATIGASAGYLSAWALNPARDFGPRLLCWLSGWGGSALPSPGSYWWVPIVGPVIGALAGGAAYQVLIRPHLPEHVAQT